MSEYMKALLNNDSYNDNNDETKYSTFYNRIHVVVGL